MDSDEQETTMTNESFQSIWSRAVAAGLEAGNAVVPTPMVVRYRGSGGYPMVDVVNDGVCGFAWVHVPDGRSPFAKWGRKVGDFSKHWSKGVYYWVGHFDQSMTRKEAFAQAAAKVLSDAGIPAYAGSRMD